MLEIKTTPLDGVLLISPRAFLDSRGSFCETYNQMRYTECGIAASFIQDNESLSMLAGTVRGLHFQSAPFAQTKLVRVLAGRIFDVAVDIRRSSATYGQWYGHELSTENGLQMLVPVGFAHGFCTLEPNTKVLYKVDNYYSSANDLGVRWDDPAIGIQWPLLSRGAVLSDKDKNLPTWLDLPTYFE